MLLFYYMIWNVVFKAEYYGRSYQTGKLGLKSNVCCWGYSSVCLVVSGISILSP